MFDWINDATEGGIYEREYTLMGDFEILLFDFLPDKVKKKCCQFHFCQCIERREKKIIYKTEEERKKGKKLKKELMCLSICPEILVESMFNVLKETYKSHELIEYFESNYMKERNNCNPIKYWNVGSEEYRTNNYSESFNREIKQFFNRRNYFNGSSKQSLLKFESILYEFIQYESCNKNLKQIKRKNEILQWKNDLIRKISHNYEDFKTRELFIILKAVMKLGRHKSNEKNNNEEEIRNNEHETNVLNDVTVDEFLENEVILGIDNNIGEIENEVHEELEDGFGNEISEVIEEMNRDEQLNEDMCLNDRNKNKKQKICMKKSIKQMDYEKIMNKMKEKHITDEENEELISNSIINTLKESVNKEKTKISKQKQQKRNRKKEQTKEKKYNNKQFKKKKEIEIEEIEENRSSEEINKLPKPNQTSLKLCRRKRKIIQIDN